MKNTSIKFTHDGTLITYNEQENKWKFTLRGRDRSAESLAKAKEFIDKPLPAEKAKPFEKIPAWLFKYDGDTPARIDVTGIAEGRGYGGGEYVWINHKGARSKEAVRFSIYPSNPKNDEIVQRVSAKREAVKSLQEEISTLKRQLVPLVLPKDE